MFLVTYTLLTLEQQPANNEETPLTSSTCSSVDLDKGTTRFLMSHDPAKWPRILKHHERCEIVGNGPVQVTGAVFPQNNEKVPRRFTKDNYDIVMKNGEKIKRSWLVYSISTDAVICFACTLFGKCENALSKGGFRTWKNIASHLKEHEYSKAHAENMESWHNLQKRLLTKTTIDQVHQDLMQIEVQHWKGVIRRVIAIICHLSERNHAFRGHTNVLFDPHNGNFLSQVELMAQFDPVLNEHIRRIQNKEVKVHYLSSTIQNEIITLIGDKIMQEIVSRVTKAKYFSVIMDCIPDVSHTEQLSVVLRIVNCESSVGAFITEHFCGFIDVQDTSGKGLFETLLEKLEKHNFRLSWPILRQWK